MAPKKNPKRIVVPVVPVVPLVPKRGGRHGKAPPSEPPLQGQQGDPMLAIQKQMAQFAAFMQASQSKAPGKLDVGVPLGGARLPSGNGALRGK